MEWFGTWLSAYWLRNYTDVLQGLLFAAFTILMVFRGQKKSRQIKKFILSFLTSYNSAQMISGLVYRWIASRHQLTGTLADFLVASLCLLVPLAVLIPLYRRVIGIPGPGAVFFYTLFFCSNCMSMLLADTAFQRMCITLVLSVVLVAAFRKELRYVFFQRSMLRMDRRFKTSAATFMVIIGMEAELPRIVLDGGEDGVGNELAYAVSLAGCVLLLFFVVFMKFNFFAIMRYENFIRSHDEDPATGARSLSCLLEHGPDFVRRAAVKGQPMAVFYTTIGNFRDVNILHGYDAGSVLLRQTADLLEEAFPEGIIARASGAHFAGVVPQKDATERFAQVAEKVEALSLDEALHLEVGLCPTSAQKAASPGKDPTERLASLVDLAASAISYPSAPGEVVRCCDENIRKQEEIRLHVLSSVDKAVKNRWLCVYYQPLVEVQGGRIAGFEALSRWIDPTYGPLTPDKFVAPLEGVRMIYKVDLNVLAAYGREVQKLQGRGLTPLPISFNISRADLESGIDLYGEIERLLDSASLDRRLVHVEITESALNGDSQVMPRAIERFHRMGLEVWMDDFGSGYSSLNVLKDYRFDVIKIDMEFMRKFDERSRVIVRSICEMASSLGTRTVAEGVETKEQYEFLQQVGCTYAQGYLFSKPQPPEAFYDALAAQEAKSSRESAPRIRFSPLVQNPKST